VDALRRSDLTRASTSTIDRILTAAEQGGVTPAERRILDRTYDRYADGWSREVRDRWNATLDRAPRGPRELPRASSGPEAEDLASPMKTVWMQGVDDVQLAYAGDMARLGAELGYTILLQVPGWYSTAGVARGLVESTGLPVEALDRVVDLVPSDEFASVWGEDNKILTNGGLTVLVPPDIDTLSVEKAMLYTADEGYHPYKEGFQGAVDDREEGLAAREMAEDLGERKRRIRTYIEGGNLLPGVTSDGKAYAMVGRDTIVISAFHLDAEGAFDREAVDAQMRAMSDRGELTPDAIELAAEKLLRTKPFAFGINDALRREAAELLAKIELTKEVLADDVGLAADRLVTITQPEFHIDMHVRPLAPGEVLVNHPEACIRLIDRALEDPALKNWEADELAGMRQYAELELERMGPVYDRIIREIEDAGLIAIPAPGVFENETRLANFLNGIPGTARDGSPYYLTNASSIKPLERAFEAFVKDLGVERVEFLGGAGGGREGYSASELSLFDAGGLDCREVDTPVAREMTTDISDALGWA
jgi:hypothetical protein